MKALAAVALLSIFPSMRAAPPAGIDADRLLSAIAEIEQGAWGKPGGPCNLSYSAWTDAAPDLPYYMSANEAVAMPVYRLHLKRLSTELAANGVKVNPQTLGTAWRWGITGARRRHWTSDQGQRTANLYDDLKAVRAAPSRAR